MKLKNYHSEIIYREVFNSNSTCLLNSNLGQFVKSDFVFEKDTFQS